MKVAVIGANGQLGSDICESFSKKYEVVKLYIEDMDITNNDQVNNVLGSIKPDYIINTAAYHNVPKCEVEISTSFEVNAIGALHLAQFAEDNDATLIHYSTDYVFDGYKKSPYIESDLPNPLSVYANSKLAGEYFIKNYCQKYFIIRISGIYGKVPCMAKDGNFISKIVAAAKTKPEIKVVKDEILTPTSTRSIAENTLKLIETDAYDLYHMTCEGFCSWYEFTQVIFSTLNIKTPLIACSVNDFPQNVKRPFYSVLENRNLKDKKLNFMPFWKDELINFLNKNYK